MKCNLVELPKGAMSSDYATFSTSQKLRLSNDIFEGVLFVYPVSMTNYKATSLLKEGRALTFLHHLWKETLQKSYLHKFVSMKF